MPGGVVVCHGFHCSHIYSLPFDNYFLLRGDFKTIVNMGYIGAMGHPGGGRNDIPNRLKSKFFSINMILPSITSADNIYGTMTRARFNHKQGASPAVSLFTSIVYAYVHGCICDVSDPLLANKAAAILCHTFIDHTTGSAVSFEKRFFNELIHWRINYLVLVSCAWRSKSGVVRWWSVMDMA